MKTATYLGESYIVDNAKCACIVNAKNGFRIFPDAISLIENKIGTILVGLIDIDNNIIDHVVYKNSFRYFSIPISEVEVISIFPNKVLCTPTARAVNEFHVEHVPKVYFDLGDTWINAETGLETSTELLDIVKWLD